MDVHAGRTIPLSEQELVGVNRLREKHGDGVTSLVRRDPGETGPVVVHIGGDAYEVDADGHTHKQKVAG